MPYDDPDPLDPMTLHGVALETDDDRAIWDMAECFVEEYARLGFKEDRLLRMFRTPGCAGPFLAYETFGPRAIQTLIDQTLQRFSPRREGATLDIRPTGDIGLPVLD